MGQKANIKFYFKLGKTYRKLRIIKNCMVMIIGLEIKVMIDSIVLKMVHKNLNYARKPGQIKSKNW